MKYKQHPTYKEHSKIGFPKFSKEEQYEILTNFDYTKVMSLIPDWKIKQFPMGTLREYISVNKVELKKYIISNEIVQRDLNNYSKTADGKWIRKHGKNYEFFERERGIEFNNKKELSYEQITDELVAKYGVYCKD